MGYWIIVVLIILGGVLVLIASASDNSNDAIEKTRLQVQPIRQQVASRSQQPHLPDRQLTLVVLMPVLWIQDEQSLPEVGIPGVATEIYFIRSSMLSDVVTAAGSPAMSLGGSITAILVGADDFLAGHSLDAVLNGLDRLLDHLALQPAMAVVGSIPDIGPLLAETLTGVQAESISATVALWNDALADLVRSHSAEFVDLGAVPVRMVRAEGNIPELTVSAVPDLPLLAAALTQACGRAADRVRSMRAET